MCMRILADVSNSRVFCGFPFITLDEVLRAKIKENCRNAKRLQGSMDSDKIIKQFQLKNKQVDLLGVLGVSCGVSRLARVKPRLYLYCIYEISVP